MDKRLEVMDIDRQFCKDCINGKEKAWVSYFLDDGFMVTAGDGPNLVGKEQIENAMKPMFNLPDVEFTWEPDYCEVSEDGTLAVTKGTSLLQYTKDNETVTRKGNYTTIWKYVNGSWKISWDIGN